MRLSDTRLSDTIAAPEISVLVPAYRAEAFIARALASLQAQSFPAWEAIVIDDSPDAATRLQVQPFLQDVRFRSPEFGRSFGLGAALNLGLNHARGSYIAYLPADDLYYRDHLRLLYELLVSSRHSPLAYSGMRCHYNKHVSGRPDGEPLQLVQVLHRAGPERWVDRSELESDDLERLFWRKLGPSEHFAALGEVTCEWVEHPHQRHKLMREPEGGLPRFKEYYGVSEPLRFHSSIGNEIDERTQFGRVHSLHSARPAGLKIVLTGEASGPRQGRPARRAGNAPPEVDV